MVRTSIFAAALFAFASGRSFARSPLTDSTDVQISAALEFENSVFVSPLDPNVILVGNNTVASGVPQVNFWISTDAGKTWASNFVSPLQSTDPTAAISGNIAPSGRFLAGFYQVSQHDVRLRYKDNTSNAWSSDVLVSGTYLDKPHLWVDNSMNSPPGIHRYHMYGAWTRDAKDVEGNPTRVVHIRRSINDGATWPIQQDLDLPDVQGANIQTGRTGRVYVIATRVALGLGFSESKEDVLPDFELKPMIELPAAHPAPWLPSMTVDKSDPTRDHLYVVWASYTPGSFIRIMKGSALFSGTPQATAVVWDTANIGTVNPGTGHGSLPWIAWDECTGMLSVTWLDLRNPAGRETYIAIAQTRDSSGNFLDADDLVWTELKVSDAHMITPTIPTPGYDYIGIAAGDGRVFPVWSDDRTQESAFRPYVSSILLWGVTQSSVTIAAVNNGNGTMTVTSQWGTNLPAPVADQVTVMSPNGVQYTSNPCSTCGGSDGKTHALTFAGIPCAPGLWTYTVKSQRSGCSMSRTSDAKTFFVAPSVALFGHWPTTAGSVAKCPAGDPISYDYTVDLQFQGSCVSQVPKARMTLEALATNPALRKLAFFPQGVPQPADADATSGGGYQTTITERQVGGCGSDSARVYLDGVAVGKAWVPFVPNVDLSGDGFVDASDMPLFAISFGKCAGSAGYDPCANFVGSSECVDASDLSVLATHFGHSWSNPVFKSGGAAGAVTKLRIEPGTPPGSLNVALRLEGLRGSTAFGVVLRPSTSKLQRGRWIPRTGYETTTVAVDTLDAQGRRLALVALAVEPDAAGNIELGTLVFATSGGDVTLGDLPIVYEDVAAPGAARIAASEAQPPTTAYATQLLPNFPNPFNPSTSIRYTLGEETDVWIKIYDIAGREVRSLVHAREDAGAHVVVWDGRDQFGRPLGSGLYAYRLTAGSTQQTRKLVMLR